MSGLNLIRKAQENAKMQGVTLKPSNAQPGSRAFKLKIIENVLDPPEDEKFEPKKEIIKHFEAIVDICENECSDEESQ